MFLKILNILILIVTLGFNYLGMESIFGPNNIANISNTYQNVLTPPSWAFAIWGLIYTGLLIFCICQFIPKLKLSKSVKNINIWFIISCMLNIMWIIAFSFGTKTSIMAAFITLVFITCTLFIIQQKVKFFSDKRTTAELLCVDIPFSIYLGWTIFAMFANLSILPKVWNVQMNEMLYYLIIMLVITFVYLTNLYFNNNFVTTLVYLYVLAAFLIKNYNENQFNFIYTSGITVFVVLNMIIQCIVNKKRYKKKMQNYYVPMEDESPDYNTGLIKETDV